MINEYDVIVVGGGHAGNEAAAAAANLGSSTLLITMNMATIGQMSCNPAMGGIAKGQIVREIDALGGYSGIVSDKSTIQFRMLNMSKGPAMWSPRTQNDRMVFANEWRLMLEGTKNLDFWQDMVSGLIIKEGRVCGVKTSMGLEIKCKSVILTNGTFLNGLIHLGEKQFGGGRVSERASTGITEQLIDLGFESGRMKTGTPPRVDGRSLDFSKMEEQFGDIKPQKFSFLATSKEITKQRSCYITYTNPEVHTILREGFDRSPMFNGQIDSTGPRYCPSIEDKINRFSERNRHQIFVEPEGWDTCEIYVNGFSTSMPEDIQYNALRKIEGFENVKMFRPGYAIEYDYFPPTQLNLTLETKNIENLYFAGQINGTTGYEEAACQGLMAGINAHNKLKNKEAFILSRSEAYIGVLIDDLVTKGTEEPYRMFTSRAEHRLLLRQDNADLRLTPKGFELGLASEERMKQVGLKKQYTEELIKYLGNTSIEPSVMNPILLGLHSAEINQKVRMDGIISRPNLSLFDLIDAHSGLKNVVEGYGSLQTEVCAQAEIQIKYKGYLEKESESVRKTHSMDKLKLRGKLNYKSISSLSSEASEKLSKLDPETLGQASRISGVSPADISVLMVHLGK